MTIPADDSEYTYTGNGSATAFDGPRTFEEGHISVYTTDSSGTTSQVTSGYTVSHVGSLYTACLVTFDSPPADGIGIDIRRTVPYVQNTSVRNQGLFHPEIHENTFDWIVMMIQQLVRNTFQLTLSGGKWVWNALGSRIINVGDPINGGDAANKKYVDTEIDLEKSRAEAAEAFLKHSIDHEAAIRSAWDAYLERQLHGVSPTITPSIDSIAALRLYEPLADGEAVTVLSSAAKTTNPYGLCAGGGVFIYVQGLSSDDFPDDGGTIVVTTNGNVWIREELMNGAPEVKVEWWGADNTYTSDSTAAIQAACDAAVFWLTTGQINTAYTTGGPIGPKPTVVMPRAWRITSTITVNMSYVEIDLNNSVGLIYSSGTYATNPGDNAYTAAFLCNGTLIDGLPYISAYYHGNFMRNGTLVYGSLNSKGGIDRHSLSDSKVVGLHLYGSTATLWSAVTTFNNVAFSSLGVGITNGDYGWGYTFNDCKFEQCYYPFRLYAAADNGEKMLFVNCMLFNCGYLGDMNTWGSDFKWIGGSWDYPKVGGLLCSTGNSGSAVVELSPSRVEYSPAEANPLIDASGTQNIIHLRDAYIKFAAESGEVAAAGALFKMAYHDQFTLDHCSIKDVSWSATACQNLKITNDYRYYRRGNHSYTLPDYFINRGGVNSKNVNSWTVSPASSYLTCTKSISANTLTITSSATSATDQTLYLFVPMDVPQVSQLLTAMLTASKPDISLAVTFGIGYLKDGAVTSNLFIGGKMSLKDGITYPYTQFTGYSVGNVVTVAPGAPYDGLYLKFELYNLISGSGSVVIDCAGTGLIHV